MNIFVNAFNFFFVAGECDVYFNNELRSRRKLKSALVIAN